MRGGSTEVFGKSYFPKPVKIIFTIIFNFSDKKIAKNFNFQASKPINDTSLTYKGVKLFSTYFATLVKYLLSKHTFY